MRSICDDVLSAVVVDERRVLVEGTVDVDTDGRPTLYASSHVGVSFQESIAYLSCELINVGY